MHGFGVHFENTMSAGGHFIVNTSNDSNFNLYGGEFHVGDQRSHNKVEELILFKGDTLNVDGTNLYIGKNQVLEQVVHSTSGTNTVFLRMRLGQSPGTLVGGSGAGSSIVANSAAGLSGYIQPFSLKRYFLAAVEGGAPAGVPDSDLLYADGSAHRWKMNNSNGGGKTVAALESDTFTTPTLSQPQISGATPTAAKAQVALGSTTGFGNGSPGTAVTTTTKDTGSGPSTPETIVRYLKINISGTDYWIPLVQ